MWKYPHLNEDSKHLWHLILVIIDNCQLFLFQTEKVKPIVPHWIFVVCEVHFNFLHISYVIILCAINFYHGHTWCAYPRFKSCLWNPLCKLFNYESIISPYWCHWGLKQEMTNFSQNTHLALHGNDYEYCIVVLGTYTFPRVHWFFGLIWHLEMEGSKNAPLFLYSGKAFRKLISLIMGNLDFFIDILYYFCNGNWPI
jgi:hypothetical protein